MYNNELCRDIYCTPWGLSFAMKMLHPSLVSILLLMSGWVLTSHAEEDAIIVRTEHGRLRGMRVGKANVFLGVPYALPPLGNLRWRPPVEREPWTGVREATRYASPATQRIPNPSGMRQASEDCLYLNVFTPVKRNTQNPLPVMVYLHGGSNVQGSANMWTSGNEDLFVGQRNNVVLVTLQFRLGVIGFLAHPALTAESEHHSSGNYGFLDMIAGLRWVQKNIKPFGGDPNRVTVFGSSSGSINTGSLVASPLARGLFHRAIMQSRPMGASKLAVREKNQGLVIAEAAGVTGSGDVAAALRALPWQDLVKIQSKVANPLLGRGFYPTIDGWALLDDPLSTIRAGKHNHVPFMIGAQAQDARGRVQKTVRTEDDFHAAIDKLLRGYVGDMEMDGLIHKLSVLYPVDQYKSYFWAMVDLTNDRIHISSDRRIATAMAANQDEPVYWYIFDQPLAGEYSKYGADHPLINTYVFQLIRKGKLPPWYRGMKKYTPTTEDLELADTFLDYWISFSANGHLEGVASPTWPRLSPEHPRVQIISTPIESRANHRAEKLAYWDKIAKAYRDTSDN